jgi:hypothetical protein
MDKTGLGVFCTFFWSIQILNVFSILKTQGGDTFWSENIVTFESSFLIRQPIIGHQYDFREQDFC